VIVCGQTKRKGGIGDEAARMAMNQLNRNSASPAPKKGGKEKAEVEKKEAKKGVSDDLTFFFGAR
jgi:hypothetical protein